MNQHQPLSRYEAARRALAEAHRVDEAKDIRDRWVALETYAEQAKNTELLRYATEIRFRAERRWGELYAASNKARGAEGNPGGRGAPIVRSPNETAQTLAELGVTKTQSSKWQQLAALPGDKFEIRVEHAKARVEGMTTSAPSYRTAEYTGENEWFTPPAYIEAAREVLVEIDLDPATHPLAQTWVRAKTFFTAADNGLEQPWSGRVFLNPPYERRLLAGFVDKLMAEHASGRVERAILLVHSCTDTQWFQAAARASQAICLASGRIHFVAPCGDTAASTVHGQTFFYFGTDGGRFEQVFSAIGLIVRPA